MGSVPIYIHYAKKPSTFKKYSVYSLQSGHILRTVLKGEIQINFMWLSNDSSKMNAI